MADFSQMIAIPQHEYSQLTTVQNARQPLTQQFYRLENEYQKNALISDPQRSISLQAQTIERMKDLKDQMRNYLSISIPKPYRSRADSLLQSIISHVQVNDLGELIKDDGTPITSSRFEDLIQHAVRDRRRKFIPQGWNYFVNLLNRYNVPKSVLNRETLDELESSSTIPSTNSSTKLMPSKLRAPQILESIKTEPKQQRSPHKPRGRAQKRTFDEDFKQTSRMKRKKAPVNRYMLLDYK